MKNFIVDINYIKTKILPKLENKIRSELIPIIDKELKEKNIYNNEEREKFFNSYKEKILNELGYESLETFIEYEYYDIIKKFNNVFPYKSIDHFIETSLNDFLKKLENN